MVAGIVALTYALAFVMPSNMSRIALLMPIVMALADRAGFAERSPGRYALALAVGFGTYELSASILPSNVPNLIMTGAAEHVYGIQFNYLPYLWLHAPVVGVLKGILITVLLWRMFPASPQRIEADGKAPPWSAAELRLSVILLVTLLLWMTDAWHGIRPAWVGLVSGVPLPDAAHRLSLQRRILDQRQHPHLHLSRRDSRARRRRRLVGPRQ